MPPKAPMLYLSRGRPPLFLVRHLQREVKNGNEHPFLHRLDPSGSWHIAVDVPRNGPPSTCLVVDRNGYRKEAWGIEKARPSPSLSIVAAISVRS